MKLAELMNDDTCQILLAIIVGIVICYFIFGSCSSGTCNRDGFSVGGERCNDYMTRISPFCSGTPKEDAGLSTSGERLDPSMWHGDRSQTDCCIHVRNPDFGLPRGEATCNFDTDTDPDSHLDNRTRDGTTFREDLQLTRALCDGDSMASNLYSLYYQNILNDMIHAISKLAPTIRDPVDADGADFLAIQQTPIPNQNNFSRLYEIASSNNIYFGLMGSHMEPTVNEYLINFSKIIHSDNTDFEYQGVRVGGIKIPSRLLSLGEYFSTYSLAPNILKKEVYCRENSMTVPIDSNDLSSGSTSKYDPILKTKSSVIVGDGVTNPEGMPDYEQQGLSRVHCPGGEGTIFPSTCTGTSSDPQECDFYIEPDSTAASADPITVDNVSLELSRIAPSTRLVVNDYNRSKDHTRSLTKYINSYEIVVRDTSASVDDSKFVHTSSRYIHITIGDLSREDRSKYRLDISDYHPHPSSYINFDNEGTPIDSQMNPHYRAAAGGSVLEMDIPLGNYTLMKAYGMSQLDNGEIYHSKKDEAFLPFTNNVYDYFNNLLTIQYLITKILLNPTRYLTNADNSGDGLNIYNKIANTPLGSFAERVDLPTTFTYGENQMCENSGKDYILLVFKPKIDVMACSGDETNYIPISGIPNYINGNRTGINVASNIICTIPAATTSPPPPPSTGRSELFDDRCTNDRDCDPGSFCDDGYCNY